MNQSTKIETKGLRATTITVWEAIQKRSHEPIYKTYTKIEAKGSDNFAIAKLVER